MLKESTPNPRFHASIWSEDGPQSDGITVEQIDGFSARGMRAVYGRGDHFGRQIFHMDVWLTREGRFLARFWSRCAEVDWESWEVLGLPISMTKLTDKQPSHEEFVPTCLRDVYDDWIIREMWMP